MKILHHKMLLISMEILMELSILQMFNILQRPKYIQFQIMQSFKHQFAQTTEGKITYIKRQIVHFIGILQCIEITL